MTVEAVVSAQTVYQQAGSDEYLFPAMCKTEAGDFLMVARRATGHSAGDGALLLHTSATGLAGSWSAGSVLWDPSGRDARAGLPRLLDDGRVVVAAWSGSSSVSAPYVTTTLVSTDETCSAWVQGGDLPDQLGGGAAWAGNACESPVVVIPDGTWLLATYGPEMNGDSAWSSLLYESSDEGATWTFKTFIARAPLTTPRFGTPNYEEPFLLHISSYELICAVRCGESGWDGSVGRYTRIFRSTDAGATWADEGRVNSTHQHASRMALCRNPLTGTIMLHHRLLYTSGGVAWSGHGAYYWSDDDGGSWSSGTGLDSEAAPPSNPTSPPMYSYGDIVAHDGGFAALWADETPISGSGSAIRFATYSDDAPLLPTPAEGYGNTVSSGYGAATAYTPQPASITVDPASTAWEQIDTNIIVRVTSAPSTVTATVYSGAGGLLRLRGTNADLFDVSLDGTTWASAIDVDAGESEVHLRVTPEAPGTTLAAEIGVPV